MTRKITLCGSIAFIDEMAATKEKLEKKGFEVKMPPLTVKDNLGKDIPAKEYYVIRKTSQESDAWVWERKAEAIRKHFDKIAWADSILVLNETKNSIPGYVGANTLMEMGLAFHLQKPIYLLHQIPEQSYKEEILGMRPVLLNGNLNQIDK